eukprot:TRINITY_DN4465_c0_g4_i1.p1 TRINITY_DN4465_c0_g4~~TRINITY_DN4465_c0_g4_i1.p1  ORF type:complete len:372 (+),score=93.59 TRINITY_DN4465_c0_g4_i1:802-1917(+)
MLSTLRSSPRWLRRRRRPRKRMSSCSSGRPAIWLDIRSNDEFRKMHLKNSMNIEWSPSFVKRLFMLPNQQIPFGLVSPTQDIADEAIVLLKAKGWKFIEPIITEFVDEEDEVVVDDDKSEHQTQLPAFLFQPSPFLSACIGRIELELLTLRQSLSSNHHELKCCDLGCGSGRNAVWLASARGSKPTAQFPLVVSDGDNCDDEQKKSKANGLSYDWRITAVDCFPMMLENLVDLALELNCVEKIDAQCAKITGDGAVKEVRFKGRHSELIKSTDTFENEKFDLILCVRFLQTSFFPQLVKMLNPGGFVLISTFSKSGEEKQGAGPRNKNRVVKEDQLVEFFQDQNGFEVIVNSEDSSEDGRSMHSFLARAPI